MKCAVVAMVATVTLAWEVTAVILLECYCCCVLQARQLEAVGAIGGIILGKLSNGAAAS